MTPLQALMDAQSQIKLSANHRYYVDGRPVPGTTTLIKCLDAPQLDNWRVRQQVSGTARAAFNNPPQEDEPIEAYTARLEKLAAAQYEADRVADEAAIEGTQVHELIAWRLWKMMGVDAPRPVVSEEAAFRESGWLHWAKDVKLKPLAVEAKLFNRALRYCGTLDLLAEVEGRIGLLDYKRSKAVYESHHLQSIGYRMALEEIGFDPMPGYVLLMPPGGDPDLRPCRDDEATREAFRACVSLYNWTRSLAKDKRGEGSR